MSQNEKSKALNQVNNTAVSDGDLYTATPMGEKISRTDPNTRTLISSTFGVIKNHILEMLWLSTGFDPNVNYAYQVTMTDPNLCVEYSGRKFYQHPGVGAIKAYNDAGNPSQGCFTMHTMA